MAWGMNTYLVKKQGFCRNTRNLASFSYLLSYRAMACETPCQFGLRGEGFNVQSCSGGQKGQV